MHYIAEFCIYNLKIFRGMIAPDPRESAFGAWTHRHQFPLRSSALPLFLLAETTNATESPTMDKNTTMITS